MTRRKQIVISALVFAFMLCADPVPSLASSVGDLKKQQEDARKKEEETRSKLSAAEREKNTALFELDAIDLELTEVTDTLEIINRELEKTTQLFMKTELELDHAVKEKEIQMEVYKKRVRFMYIYGKGGYLSILFKSKDFADLINRMEYINRIVAYDQEATKRLKDSEDLVATKLEEVRIQKQEMQVLSSRQTEKMNELEDKLYAKQQFVNSLDADMSRYENMIATLDQTDKYLEQLIKDKQAAAARAASSGSSAQKGAAGQRAYTGGKLAWPVPVGGRISSGYGGRTNPISGRGEFHTGIDIPAPTGSAIVAAEGGTVISAGWQNGYGNTIVVDHGNGLSTMYAHCSSLVAGVGQRVERGGTIAKIGSTGYSTGPHLHFEVRVSGGHTNPTNYFN